MTKRLAGAAVGDPVDVAEQGADLAGAADLDVLLPGPGHDAGAQRLKDGVALARADLCRTHASISRATSRLM